MKKPSNVISLLEELNGECIESDVDILKTSKMVVFVNDDDDTGFELSADETKLVLANTDTVQRFAEALDHPGQSSVALFDVRPNDRVMRMLESNFSAVDEG